MKMLGKIKFKLNQIIYDHRYSQTLIYSLTEENIQLGLLLLDWLVWNQTLLWYVGQNYNLDDDLYQNHTNYNQGYHLDNY